MHTMKFDSGMAIQYNQRDTVGEIGLIANGGIRVKVSTHELREFVAEMHRQELIVMLETLPWHCVEQRWFKIMGLLRNDHKDI